jgi:hypothetical protein
MIKNTENITLQSAQDDLCIVLEEILTRGRPSTESMAQIEYAQEQLTKLISTVESVDVAHNAANLLKTINIVLNTFSDENYGVVKVAKAFGNYNSHVTLSGDFIGKRVLVTEIIKD